MNEFRKDLFRPWLVASIFWLLLIVFLGTAMRFSFGFQIQLPTPIDFMRHAHSHTGFWGWAGPIFFGFIFSIAIDEKKRNSSVEKFLFLSTQTISLLAILSFIMSGYSRVSIILATLMTFVWLGFAFYFFKSQKKISEFKTPILFQFIRIAVVLLVFSTLPTFFIPITMSFHLGTENTKTIAIHFFLEMFSEGWLYLMSLVVLSFLVKNQNSKEEIQTHKGKFLFFLLIPMFFILAFRPSIFLLPPILQPLIFSVSLIWGILQIILSIQLARGNKFNSFSIVLLLVGLKGFLDILFTVPLLSNFISSKPVTIFYMHLKLLGIISTVIILFFQTGIVETNRLLLHSKKLFLTGVVVTMIALLMLVFSIFPAHWVNLLLGVNTFWVYGQIFAMVAGVLIFMGVIGIYINLLYIPFAKSNFPFCKK